MARVYDALLRGKDNFAADRHAALLLQRRLPDIVLGGLENRHFLARAVAVLSHLGVDQFLDIGVGLPYANPVHEVAQRINPSTKVVYSDNDLTVVVHARALLAINDNVRVVPGDLRRPHALLRDPGVTEFLDWSRPVALVVTHVFDWIPAADPEAIMHALRDALPSGSWLIFSHATTSHSHSEQVDIGCPDAPPRSAPMALTLRPHHELLRIMAGVELLDPGLVPVVHWRPEHQPLHSTPCAIAGAVGRFGKH
ncbi:hypothetical protein Ssi02_08350 [Sinosporangium siamense]|uniref:S-adenosyl methyltransferase n=2 Tax=Sinosporangium siamense TaxID=1367973 RepID=A0A919V9Z8_9ACTN|nr:hypothetical protein Ssi02_08350 [Sinosporangium siamense]